MKYSAWNLSSLSLVNLIGDPDDVIWFKCEVKENILIFGVDLICIREFNILKSTELLLLHFTWAIPAVLWM